MSKLPWYRQLHWQILIGMVVGTAVGLLTPATWVPYYAWAGDLFLRALKMVVVPLVTSSIIVGVARLGDTRTVGRLGGTTVLYYMATSALAILTGLVAVNILRPGVGVVLENLDTSEKILSTGRSLGDLVYDLIPVNPIGAMADFAMSEGGSNALIGVIFFCALFGLAAGALPGEKRDRVLGFFDGVFAVMMTITQWIIRTAPLAVAALIAKVLALTGTEVVLPLLGYMGTVILALGVHFFGTIPLILYVFGRRNPYTYMRQVGLALITALTTASSNATLPISMDVAPSRGGVDPKVSGFVLPLGATVNMDGSALYEGVAAIFVAQLYGRQLGIDEQALIFLTALVASVGAAGIPHASLVMMAVVFEAVGLPLEAVGVLLGVDRVLTMCRTTTNVWSDLAGAAVLDRVTKSNPPDPPKLSS